MDTHGIPRRGTVGPEPIIRVVTCPRGLEPKQFVFPEYNPEELQATPDYTPVFRAGDLLAEAPEHRERWLENGKIIQESMLAMVRLQDDVVDSVWPEEVRRLT